MNQNPTRGVLGTLASILTGCMVLNPNMATALGLTAFLVLYGFLEMLWSHDAISSRVDSDAKGKIELLETSVLELTSAVAVLETTVTQINNRTRKPGQP